jgi:hypothetical protein
MSQPTTLPGRSQAVEHLPDHSRPGDEFTQTNLVSDLPGLAVSLDPHLVNPWGIAFGPTSPFWISDNGTGLTTLYDGAGHILSLTVTIATPPSQPPPATPHRGRVQRNNRLQYYKRQRNLPLSFHLRD